MTMQSDESRRDRKVRHTPGPRVGTEDAKQGRRGQGHLTAAQEAALVMGKVTVGAVLRENRRIIVPFTATMIFGVLLFAVLTFLSGLPREFGLFAIGLCGAGEVWCLLYEAGTVVIGWELAHARVRVAEGHIEWSRRRRRGRYTARVGGRSLHILAVGESGKGTVLLAKNGSASAVWLPGLYQFFYLPLTHVLVAAISLDEPPAWVPYVHVALADAFRFTTADIEANRAGKVSLAQRQVLRKRCLRALAGMLIWPAGVMAFILPLPLFGSHDPLTLEGAILSGLVLVMAGAFGLVLASFLYTLYSARFGRLALARSLRRDLRDGDVAEIQGIGRKVTRTTEIAIPFNNTENLRKIRQRYLIVGNRAFRLRTHSANEAVFDGMVYRVYYAPHSGVLLSVDPVSAPDSSLGGSGSQTDQAQAAAPATVTVDQDDPAATLEGAKVSAPEQSNVWIFVLGSAIFVPLLAISTYLTVLAVTTPPLDPSFLASAVSMDLIILGAQLGSLNLLSRLPKSIRYAGAYGWAILWLMVVGLVVVYLLLWLTGTWFGNH